jgi:hypothetical protein
MATQLSKPLSRELTRFPGVTVTLTETGIQLRVKRRHRSLEIPWEKVFGVAAMREENEQVIMSGCELILRELGYFEYQDQKK